MAITLAELHTQVNLDITYTDDDVYLNSLLAACTIAVKNRIFDRTEEDITLKEPLKLAILILVANFYMNREPVAFVQVYVVPFTFDFLISDYINYSI